MNIKPTEVFLVQFLDEQHNLAHTVVISLDAVKAKKSFQDTRPETPILGFSCLQEYIDTHSKIINSIKGNPDAWPVIVDEFQDDF